MKKVIDGIPYDTAKAELVGNADNIRRGAESWSDFRAWAAGLYRVPGTGRYFLAGHGGRLTIFGRSVGNSSWAGGEDIIPVSRDDARRWAEANLPKGTFERFFELEDA